MNLAKAKLILENVGVTIRKKDGEYRVNFKVGGTEESAAYTNDIQDAVNTGIAMGRWRNEARLNKNPRKRTKVSKKSRKRRTKRRTLRSKPAPKRRKLRGSGPPVGRSIRVRRNPSTKEGARWLSHYTRLDMERRPRLKLKRPPPPPLRKKTRKVVLKTNPQKAVPYIIRAKTVGGGHMYYNATRESFDTNRNVATQMTLTAAKREAQRIHLMLPLKILSIGVHKVKER